jgi:dihydroneopterin aldolase
MTDSIQIKLNELRFYSFHGLFPEEKILGGEFEVNVIVKFATPATIIDSIHQTPNYVSLFNLIKEEMKIPRELLETIAMSIGKGIKIQFPVTDYVRVSIKKLHPPIKQFVGNVEVVFEKDFN